jgi:hypothetical protein
MSGAAIEATARTRLALPSAARDAMEKLNAQAGGLHIWLRTQANAPAQQPWFKDVGIEGSGAVAPGRVGTNQMKAEPHRWRWREIGPYLDRIAEIARNADVSPIEFADRQQFLLTNPGLGGRLQVAATIRCAVSIYLPGDVAPVHLHAPNASRTILSENGGYTTIEGERCEAARGDLILTRTAHGTITGMTERLPCCGWISSTSRSSNSSIATGLTRIFEANVPATLAPRCQCTPVATR